eukprot:TRINITY_DN49755_c0_g1_i1.p1 TRINITY_DN49755_c0_g1~~TRINITY_DN49755_c0_g1_i1.p1  ORF type:complete len:219 (-),score=42.18 TRINITY_DN49755_c0_g1_i1:194-802(-)
MGAQCSSEPASALIQDGGKFIVYYHGACKSFWGRCLPIGMLLETAGVMYEFKLPEEQPEGAGFAVPMMTFPDGTTIAQSPAIMLALGEAFGLAPNAARERVKHNQLILDASDLAADRAKPQERLDKWFSYFEKVLVASGSGYLMQTVTAADFQLFLPIYNLKREDKLSATQFPYLTAWHFKISQLPAAKKFLDSGVPVMPSS